MLRKPWSGDAPGSTCLLKGKTAVAAGTRAAAKLQRTPVALRPAYVWV